MCEGKNKGFSLIEIMISLTIGLIVIGAVSSLYISNKRSFSENSRYARQQENGRYAILLLEEEMRNSGFFGTVKGTDVDTSDISIAGTDCSGKMAGFNLSFNVWGTRATSSTVNSCLNNVVVGTDIIVFKGTRGITVADGSLDGNTVYIRANRLLGKLFEGSDGVPSNIDVANATDLNWPYVTNAYYIKNVAGVPTFTRHKVTKESGTTQWQDEELISGIENMHILYGVDKQSSDGIPDYFDNAAKIELAGDWDKVVAVKIYLLVRGEKDPLYTDTKTYQLGDISIPAATGSNVNFHRKVWSTSVVLENSWITQVSKLH